MFWKVLDLFCQLSSVPSSGRMLTRAMASGIPVIASDVVGLRAWIEPEINGVLVPPDVPDALARAIRDLIQDRPRAEALGCRARLEIARRCDPQREAEHLAQLYRRVIDRDAPDVLPVPEDRETVTPRSS